MYIHIYTSNVNKMPKLPSFFNIQTQNSTTTESHNGRVRTIPHKVDSWATYVYFKVNLSNSEIIKKISAYLNNQVELMKEEFHISLSRPIYFRKYQLDSFTSDIRNAVKDIESFNISFAQLACLTNEEKTRSFLTLEIGNGYNELLHCMKSIDTILTQYRKPVFYNPPRFHTSIAWSLSEKVIQSLKIPSSVIEEDLKEAYHLTKIYIKMGHKIETIPLK
ncbi:U6 snRNA phosphodiesterase Usb1 [Cokeromyces recurvatus]|uniref:U6 snRNA phosphodiesterase Usb1 n=1 Tax=Cokeromyces recurvatus TaxID=90255 RepID=UPI0022209B77|nr:U6 snRNA phosphodiesterase Usb1 [Cokeromyces recurvatus]KAI7898175.1 U6 snRNA phosphodiesterase Usb1 [Cokeromyces recurvatus]